MPFEEPPPPELCHKAIQIKDQLLLTLDVLVHVQTKYKKALCLNRKSFKRLIHHIDKE